MSLATEAGPLLSVNNLDVVFRVSGGVVRANRNVCLEVFPGETVGIVGESGSGKSVLCRAVLRLLPKPIASIRNGSITFEGKDLLALSEARMRELRGTEIAMVFQNPMTSLSPVWSIGDQVTEGLRVHRGVSQSAAREAGIDLMRATGIAEPERRYDEHSWQWSGGMLQRAAIAMAMSCEPKLLLADEPTTALDVTVQEQILALLTELQQRRHMAMVLVSHDIGVIAETCDRIAVMYAGSIVETGPASAVLNQPRHPYTLGLLQSSPGVERQDQRLQPIPGQPPDLEQLSAGCPFADRCAFVSSECRNIDVALSEGAGGHATACKFPERIQ